MIRFGVVLAVLGIAGCVPKSGASDGGDTTTTQTATESGEPSESSTSEDTQTDTADESGSFVPVQDFVGPCSLSELSLCDEFTQDCGEGHKCVPFHIADCSFPSCMPVTGDKPAGEPCTANAMGHDDCDADSWCYPGTLDVELPPVCIPFCQGTADASFCDDPSLTCVFDDTVYDGVLGCRPSCDPLMSEGCEPWERCTFAVDWLPDFGCVLGGGIANGEVCVTNQECDDGVCVPAESLLECADASCCSPWCDITAPNCAMGLECIAVGVGEPNSNVGVCRLP